MKLETIVNVAGDEQETIITLLRNEDGFRLYTCDNLMITKLNKLINAQNTAWKLEKTSRNSDGTPNGYFFTCSVKNCLSLKAKKQPVREMSEEEKMAASERMKIINANRRG